MSHYVTSKDIPINMSNSHLQKYLTCNLYVPFVSEIKLYVGSSLSVSKEQQTSVNIINGLFDLGFPLGHALLKIQCMV